MNKVSRRWILASLIAASCAPGDFLIKDVADKNYQGPSFSAFSRPEKKISSNDWIGSKLHRLTAKLGPPDLILDPVPTGARTSYLIEEMAYVYIPDTKSGGNCYDTYVIDLQNEEIIKYYCR